MATRNAKRRRTLWRVGSLLILVLLVVFSFLRYASHAIWRNGQRSAAHGVEEIAQRLHERFQEPAVDPASLTLDELMGWGEDGFRRFGHFDHGKYSLQIAGEPPVLAGTVIRYDGIPPQTFVVLTVRDSGKREWEVHVEPMPEWWQVWK